MTAADQLTDDVDALKAALLETRAKLMGATALIEHLQLVIEKMKREKFGPRSERSQRLIDQMELQLEELAAAQGEDQARAETAVPVRGLGLLQLQLGDAPPVLILIFEHPFGLLMARSRRVTTAP
jgi:uncharacterized protein with PIN domain